MTTRNYWIGVVSQDSTTKESKQRAVSLEFAGGRRVAGSPGGELPGKVNRIMGNDRSKWLP